VARAQARRSKIPTSRAKAHIEATSDSFMFRSCDFHPPIRIVITSNEPRLSSKAVNEDS
jgi:hypothetical protein